MKTLSLHLQQVLSGKTDTDIDTVLGYRRAFAANGYAVPPLVARQDSTAGLFLRKHDRQSKIGDALKAIIAAENPGISTCGPCSALCATLNNYTSEQATEQIDAIVADMVARAPKKAPKLWQRVAIRIDGVLHTGQTEKKIRGWVERAIAGEMPKPQPKPVRVSRGGSFASSFKASGKPRFVTSAQMQEDVKLLVSKIPADITAIAGVARSGLAAATMISMYTHLPMYTIRQNSGDIQETGNGWRLGGSKHIEPQGQHVLVVDDTVMTGNSLKAISGLLTQFKRVTTSAVYVNPLAKQQPDVWAVDLPWPHLLEWNLFNSILSPNMAMDFDGILCRDCPHGSDDDGPKYMEFIRNAQPLYLPRRSPIPLIVTARVEKYRSETEAWMRRHGVQCGRLIMHQAAGTREREKDNIAAFKAKHFSAWAKHHRPVPAPLGFIESDDRQAREIARITKQMVICPGSAGVY